MRTTTTPPRMAQGTGYVMLLAARWGRLSRDKNAPLRADNQSRSCRIRSGELATRSLTGADRSELQSPSRKTVGSLRYVVPIESTQTNVDAALAAKRPPNRHKWRNLKLGSPVDGLLSTARTGGGIRRSPQRERAQWAAGSQKWPHDGIDLLDGKHGRLARRGGLLLRLRRETAVLQPKTYTNQIGIPGGSFADSGDSGALVLDASNAEPHWSFFCQRRRRGNRRLQHRQSHSRCPERTRRQESVGRAAIPDRGRCTASNHMLELRSECRAAALHQLSPPQMSAARAGRGRRNVPSRTARQRNSGPQCGPPAWTHPRKPQ